MCRMLTLSSFLLTLYPVDLTRIFSFDLQRRNWTGKKLESLPKNIIQFQSKAVLPLLDPAKRMLLDF